MTHVSPPFVFKSYDIEFSCGFAFTPNAAEVVLPFAQLDEFCHLARFSADSWLAKLVPVPSPDDFTFR